MKKAIAAIVAAVLVLCVGAGTAFAFGGNHAAPAAAQAGWSSDIASSVGSKLASVTAKCAKCVDSDGDGLCDVCGKAVKSGGTNSSGTTTGMHATCHDYNGNGVCDVCGKSVGSAKSSTCKGCSAYHDADGNGVCDNCGSHHGKAASSSKSSSSSSSGCRSAHHAGHGGYASSSSSYNGSRSSHHRGHDAGHGHHGGWDD